MNRVIPERTEHKYEPYPEYRDSGVEWLGKIPEHWAIKKLKYGVNLINDKVENGESENPYLGLENIESWTGRIINIEDNMEPESISNRFKPNDILFGKLRPYLAKVVHADQEGICTSELIVLRPQKECSPRFLFYYLISRDTIGIINSATYGVKMPRANWQFVGNLPFPTMEMDEQRAISDFLDSETARIDELIAKKQRLIELLQKKRIALITRTVIKGLNPETPMKDSGVEWLGGIPAHWEVKKLKYLCSKFAIYGANESSNSYIESGIRFLRTSDIDDNGDLVDDNPVHVDPSSVQDYRLITGDLLLSRSGTIGRSFLYDKNRHGECAYAGYLVRFVPNKKLMPKFAFYFTKSSSFQDWLRVSVIQSTIGNVNGQKYANMPIPTSGVTEQKAITDCLNKETSRIDALVSRINQAIEKLQEYRSALITAAVTGKIDVKTEEAVYD